MPRSLSVLALALATLVAAPALMQGAPGATDLETQFDAAISPAEMGDWMKTMAAEPNHVGSPHDKLNAEMTLKQFKDWGWDAKIETFKVLYPTPIQVGLDLVGKKTLQGDADRSADPRRRHLLPHEGRAAGLCRLPGRWRCHGAAGLRELRHARRLQGARAHGRRRQGQDRHRALRRGLARAQAEAGARAWRGRLHHLFRSARRRLRDRRRLSRRARRARRRASSAARSPTCRSIRAIR